LFNKYAIKFCNINTDIIGFENFYCEYLTNVEAKAGYNEAV